MTPDKIDKLPKWAREHIESLQRERDIAVRKLHEYIDDQTPSSIFTEECVSDGEAEKGPSFVTRYINGTRSVCFDHKGVSLHVALSDDGIEMDWDIAQRSFGDIAFIPISYQQAKLVHRDNMRK